VCSRLNRYLMWVRGVHVMKFRMEPRKTCLDKGITVMGIWGAPVGQERDTFQDDMSLILP